MNKARRAIWDKSGGRCWYCGCELPEKGWHADHFEPLGRQPDLLTPVFHEDEDGRLRKVLVEEKRPPAHPDRDHPDNLVPACQSCNTIKGMSSIEGFRETISRFINSLNSYSNQYKFAKRYGLVVETEIAVTFWFERQEFGEGSKPDEGN